MKRKNEIIEKKYKNYIKNKISKINLIKNFMNKNCNIDKLLNNNINNINEIKENVLSNNNDDNKKKIDMFKKIDPKKNKNNNIRNSEIKDEDEKEKSILPYEMTKRMNSFLDFSTILNDNSNIKESVNINRQKNVSRIVWGDVSAIEKNDDF